MRIENYISLTRKFNGTGLFYASGSFGILDGNLPYAVEETANGRVYTYSNETVTLRAEFRQEGDVTVRRDSLRNLTGETMELNAFVNRFTLDGDAYEVYTQFNGWVHENKGLWQKLVTQVTAASQGIRTCDSAAPIMGFHNCYTGKNTVFHLMPNAQWQMNARVCSFFDKDVVMLETGFCDRSLKLKVTPGEEIFLPPVIFFAADSKTDLDAWKLHNWFNARYPRRKTPILYNSWLYCFDRVNIDALLVQADIAAEMGFEGFMIDAGWFGYGENWSASVGDWVERQNSGPCGRLAELSQRVRDKGMVFGLWFEPERAIFVANAVKEHPEYYIDGGTGSHFLDFANDAAVAYILDALSVNIEKYNIGWVKFDFNATIPVDPSGSGFYRYLLGQRKFVEALKARFPDLYLTNCAAGGYRMDLEQSTLFDSYWFTDNQGPYEGLQIVAESLKRLPTCMIERWTVQKYCESFPVYQGEPNGRMIHCNNGTWDFLIGIQDSYSEEFAKGGPMAFSCDLSSFSPEYKARWSEVIAQYKRDRDFYRKATARILVESHPITVIEYADPDLNRCRVQVFARTTYADELVIFPAVDGNLSYTYGDQSLTGKDILENGILVRPLKQNSCLVVELTAEDN